MVKLLLSVLPICGALGGAQGEPSDLLSIKANSDQAADAENEYYRDIARFQQLVDNGVNPQNLPAFFRDRVAERPSEEDLGLAAEPLAVAASSDLLGTFDLLVNCTDVIKPEFQVWQIISDYRFKHGKPPALYSRSMSTVARYQADNCHRFPTLESPGCNPESWRALNPPGLNYKQCCSYKLPYQYPNACMYDKGREIVPECYPNQDLYMLAAVTTNPHEAVRQWLETDAARELILDDVSTKNWSGIGVGVVGGCTTIVFGWSFDSCGACTDDNGTPLPGFGLFEPYADRLTPYHKG